MNSVPQQIELPPVEYMEYVCGSIPDVESKFVSVGEQLAEMLERLHMLKPGADILDIGCGCGRLTRHLLNRDIGSYTGFDRHPGMIDWCRTEIATHAQNYTFDLFELKSAYDDYYDKVGGLLDASTFQFPYPDDAFDAIVLASVFTHMPLNETAHYLVEIRRVLRQGGKVLLSVFFTDDEPYTNEIDFFYKASDFTRSVRDAGLKPKRIAVTARHNWYTLTHR